MESKGIELGMSSPAKYQIIVKGKLDICWADCFNGTTNLHDLELKGGPHTTLNCQVRDQAELFGILNQLNSLNLPLMKVSLIGEEN